jgi:hypothetical protein
MGNRLYTNFGTASRFGSLLPFVERNKSDCLVSNGKSRRPISAKPVGVGAVSQRLIPTGEQSGLQTRIATTESQLAVKGGLSRERRVFAPVAGCTTKALGEIFLKNQGCSPIDKLSSIT